MRPIAPVRPPASVYNAPLPFYSNRRYQVKKRDPDEITYRFDDHGNVEKGRSYMVSLVDGEQTVGEGIAKTSRPNRKKTVDDKIRSYKPRTGMMKKERETE